MLFYPFFLVSFSKYFFQCIITQNVSHIIIIVTNKFIHQFKKKKKTCTGLLALKWRVIIVVNSWLPSFTWNSLYKALFSFVFFEGVSTQKCLMTAVSSFACFSCWSISISSQRQAHCTGAWQWWTYCVFMSDSKKLGALPLSCCSST